MTTDSAVAVDERLRANDEPYSQAVCSLPNCGKALHIAWEASMAIYLNNTAADLANPANAHSSSWHIECEGGHVLLHPIDSAEDSYTFGECKCDGDPDLTNGEWCGHFDMERLRRVIGDGHL